MCRGGGKTRWERVFSGAVMLGALAALMGCSLPAAQLALPRSMQSGGEPDAQHPGGVPLADTAALQAQVYPGSDETVADVSGEQAANSRPSSVDSDGGITLNLAGASISEAAKAVLGDILHVNYVVSDKLTSTITLRTAAPVSTGDLLAIFEAALKTEGAVIVNEGGIYRIVPAENALAAGRLHTRKRHGPQLGIATEIVPLHYVSASDLQRVLSSLTTQTSAVHVDEARNIVLISGTSSEIAALRDSISAFDVDWMRGMSFGIFPIESGNPEAIASELDTVFANDRSSPTKGLVRFVPNQRLNAVLVIAKQRTYLSRAEQWIRRLDKAANATEKQVFVYHVQNRPAVELGMLLQKVYRPQGGRADAALSSIPTTAPALISTPESGQGALDQSGTGNAPLRGYSQFGSSSDTPPPTTSAEPELEAEAATAAPLALPSTTGALPDDDRTGGIQIVPDEANNSLIITATASEYRRVRQILSRIDIAPAQVLLEATIAEVTLNDNLNFGLRWYFQRHANLFKFTDSDVGKVSSTFPGFSYMLNLSNVQVVLNALSAVTKVDVISSPSLMVIDTKKAVLQVGAQVPIATQSAVSVTNPDAPIVNSVSFRDTGILLGITPRISDNGRVLLELEQEVSDVVPTTSSNIDSPTIQQRRVKTTVAIGDGQSIVLAGLIQDHSEVQKEQVPIVADVPVLGNLFKSKDDRLVRTELLIAITPQIVKDSYKLRGIAAEFRDRLNFTNRPQHEGPPDIEEQVDRTLVR